MFAISKMCLIWPSVVRPHHPGRFILPLPIYHRPTTSHHVPPGRAMMTSSNGNIFRVTNHLCGWWFETPSHPLWRHRDGKQIRTCGSLICDITTVVMQSNSMILNKEVRNHFRISMYYCWTPHNADNSDGCIFYQRDSMNLQVSWMKLHKPFASHISSVPKVDSNEIRWLLS